MTKRLTAEEVADELRQGVHSYASMLVRNNLVPRWQDEPDGDGGLVWVRFSKEERSRYRWALPFTAWKENGEWWIEDLDELTMRLDGRQVCPITPRPKD